MSEQTRETVANLIERLLALADSLGDGHEDIARDAAARLAALRPYLQHTQNCPVAIWGNTPVPEMTLTSERCWHKTGEHQAKCTCGLATVLGES